MRSHASSVKDMKSDRLFGLNHRQNKKDPRVFFYRQSIGNTYDDPIPSNLTRS